ncbi:MAG: hypothetical protein JWQ59_1776 [Cryobacterium sp.]|jgi:hypothetical protein|nr:hypothetical protein [Cryobacterium sp.]
MSTVPNARAVVAAFLVQIRGRIRAWVGARLRSVLDHMFRRIGDETGAATAEYAVATMAAVGFAGLLIVILRGDEVRGILTELVRNALTVG